MNKAFPQPPESRRNEALVTEWIESMRPALKSYVLSLLPQSDCCDDIVQETCLFLWEKRNDFTPDSNFKAWAFKAAWFKVLSHRRDLQRRNIITFSDDILQRIAGASEEPASHVDSRIEGLRSCLGQLTAADLELLRMKYLRRESIADHARQLGWKPNRLQKSISRLRLALRHCMESRSTRSR
jgi:RNA polymerase sigma-70 factor (ECF subfamily)